MSARSDLIKEVLTEVKIDLVAGDYDTARTRVDDLINELINPEFGLEDDD